MRGAELLRQLEAVVVDVGGDDLRDARVASRHDRGEPTAPTPATSIESPSRGRASLSTAPAPVARPQASGPSSSSGSSGTFTSASAEVIE